VRYSVAASLDGYIADVGGGFDWIPHDAAVDFAAIFARVDTVLLGRRTFELVKQGRSSMGSGNAGVRLLANVAP